MYANVTRDLEGLGRPDASPENTLWATLTALERDLLIATTALEQTDTPTTANQLKRALESWYTDISHGDLYNALETLTTGRFLEGSTTAHQSHYHLTSSGRQLLETYIDHLETICAPTTVTITLERPITPGDLERAFCELRTQTQEVDR